jgi:Kef-type K+ transport system membrane component KefB
MLDMSSFLLPLFFVVTGLRTNIGLLHSPMLWVICVLLVIVGVVTKVHGSAILARLAGYSWREAWSVGALMNTRGLMELIILNIGYDLGLMTPTIFTMFVIMALVTTLLTGPLLLYLKNEHGVLS